MITATVTLIFPEGMHARPASELVKLAGKFNSEIRIGQNGKFANAKSILGLMSLGIAGGTPITIECDGQDETEAMEKVSRFLSETA